MISRTPATQLFGPPGYAPSGRPLYRGGSAAAPPSACTYPLDATESETTAFGALHMTLTNGSQTCTLSLVGAPGANRQAVAAPTGTGAGTGIKINNTVGKKAIEWGVILPASVGGGAASQAYSVNYFLASVAMTPKVEIVLARLADGTNTTQVKINAASVFTGTVIPARCAMILDAVAGTVQIRFDDVVQTLSANTYTPAQHVAGMWAYEKTACPAGDAGKLIGGTLVTDAAALTGVYVGGETDICGTAL